MSLLSRTILCESISSISLSFLAAFLSNSLCTSIFSWQHLFKLINKLRSHHLLFFFRTISLSPCMCFSYFWFRLRWLQKWNLSVASPICVRSQLHHSRPFPFEYLWGIGEIEEVKLHVYRRRRICPSLKRICSIFKDNLLWGAKGSGLKKMNNLLTWIDSHHMACKQWHQSLIHSLKI